MTQTTTTQPRNEIGRTLTKEQREQLQQFGALEWEPRDIAVCLGFDVDRFTAEYEDPESLVALEVTRGRLKAAATVGTALLSQAEAGDIPSIDRLGKIRREKAFRASKLDIFGSFADEKAFHRIYDYLADGRAGDLTNNERLFLDLLSIINSLDRQMGKRATIKFLTRELGYPYDRAADYYAQADALFYSNRRTTKEALRNKYAELLEDIAHAAKNVASTPRDYEAVSEIVARAAKLRRLDEPEAPKLSPAMYVRPLRIFSLRPEDIGLPAVNRQELREQIDRIALPEAEKTRLRREALVEDIDITELLEYGKTTDN